MLKKQSHLSGITKVFLIGMIIGYKRLASPYLPDSCRHQPTCSTYAGEAIVVHGVCKGVWMAILRIVRCNPFGSRGYDPVPHRKSE